jgi:hypothetical protein
MRLEYDPDSGLLSAALSNLVTGTTISSTLDTSGMAFTLNTFGFEMVGVQPSAAKPYIDSFQVEQSGASYIPDADKDGMPTAWEEQTGLYRDFDDSDQDPDKDLFSNYEEYLADTDPLDSGSRLRILSFIPDGEALTLRWSGGSNATQYVAFLPYAEEGSMDGTNLATHHPPTPGSQERSFSPDESSGWFRIRAGR